MRRLTDANSTEPLALTRGSGRQLLLFFATLLFAIGCGSAEQPVASASPGILDELLGRSDGRAARYFVENEIASCMKATGFEYTPLTPADGEVNATPEYFTVEFRQAYGLGLANSPDADVTTGRDEQMSSSGPNDEHLSNISDEEWEAWIDQEAVCFDDAWAEVESRQADFIEELPEETSDRLYGVIFRTAPELTSAVDSWSGCMAEEGYQYANQIEMFTSLEQELQAIGDGDGRSGFAKKEVEIALADLACDEQHVSEIAGNLETELEQDLQEELDGRGFYDS